jgi:signal transduction histidine kinase
LNTELQKSNPTGSTLTSKWPKLTIHWYESWIIKAAIAASLILFAGISTSAFFLFQSLEFVVDLVHDDEIEDTLGHHLTSIKSVHSLQQDLVLERLKPFVLPWAATSPDSLKAARVKKWLKRADVEFMADIQKVKISGPKGRIDKKDLEKPLVWLDRTRLKVINQVAEFPKGDTYSSFKKAEDLRKRYQLIGAKLTQLKPRMIRDNGFVLLISAFLLASIFAFTARRFKKAVEGVIQGFTVWAEDDEGFRFHDEYKGELKLITQTFNAMAEDVEANRQKSLYLEKIASWQIIARKLAHEIKNPLTPIQMMVSQLKRKYKGEDPDFTKLLTNAQQIITEEVSGLRRMVDNFSNFARLPQPDPKVRNLSNICAHVVELQKNAFPQHEITFENSEETLNAKVDEDLIRQVVLNLIKNAAEACGETPSKIAVSVSDVGSACFIKIKDNGPGVPEELKTRIFEAYFTTKHTGPTAGMGLGLAVCQKIVLDHGGKMSVKSVPGDTTFTISLPKKVG